MQTNRKGIFPPNSALSAVATALVSIGGFMAASTFAQEGSLMKRTQKAADRDSKKVERGAKPPAPPMIASSWIAIEPVPPRKFEPEDLITIIVRHEVKHSADGKSKQEREFSVDATLDDFIRFSNKKILQAAVSERDPTVKAQFETKMDTKQGMDRQDKIVTRITAKVLDVKPNGTLAIEASDRVKTDDEEYAITLTAICRSEDVTANNTVLSTECYRFNLEKKSSGVVGDGMRRGWMARFLDRIKPF